MAKTHRVFKIVRLSDGKFSNGGSRPSFTKAGKSWADVGHLKNHLNLFKYDNWDVYKGCELVSYEMVANEAESLNLDDYFTNFKEEAMVAKLKGLSYW